MNLEIRSDPTMESPFDQNEIVVMDCGSDTLKIGFSGEDYPQMIMPSIVGIQSIKTESEPGAIKYQYYFGSNVKDNIPYLNYYHPITRGRIKKKVENVEQKQDSILISKNEPEEQDYFGLMSKFWQNILENDMNLDATQTTVLVVDSPLNDKDYKKELTEYLFEEVKVGALLFMNSATLSLFSTGRTRGIVIESGHGYTATVPIFEGFALPHAINYSYVAGQDINKKLHEALTQMKEVKDKLDPTKISTWEVVKEIKEKVLSVALNYESAVNGPDTLSEANRMHELPDGTIIQIDNKIRYPCTEILFQPKLLDPNTDQMSLPDMMFDSLRKCDIDLRTELYGNIVFSGGTTLLKGFAARMKEEVNKFPKQVSKSEVNFIIEGNRRFAAWIGGSMLGSLSTFQSLAITKTAYEEITEEQRLALIHKQTF